MESLITATGPDRRRQAAGARRLAEQRRRMRLQTTDALAPCGRLELRTRRLRHALRLLSH